MSAANPNPMEKSMVSVLVVANAGGGSPLPCGVFLRCLDASEGDCIGAWGFFRGGCKYRSLHLGLREGLPWDFWAAASACSGGCRGGFRKQYLEYSYFCLEVGTNAFGAVVYSAELWLHLGLPGVGQSERCPDVRAFCLGEVLLPHGVLCMSYRQVVCVA
jgi:hypothetical protein